MYMEDITMRFFIGIMEIAGVDRTFSDDGLRALYSYLKREENREGKEVELDPDLMGSIYVEYEDFYEFQKDYPDFESFEELTNLKSKVGFTIFPVRSSRLDEDEPFIVDVEDVYEAM